MYEKVGNQQQFLLAWFQPVLVDQGLLNRHKYKPKQEDEILKCSTKQWNYQNSISTNSNLG